MQIAAAVPISQHRPTERTVKAQVTRKEWSSASPTGASKSTDMVKLSMPVQGAVVQSRM
ncbi:hypothetical protein RKD37_001852 [Streptomyces ambofaciens]